jgi:hypothetical protein
MKFNGARTILDWLLAAGQLLLCAQGVALGPGRRFFVEAVDVALELLAIDAPHSPAPELDGRQLAHQAVGLGLGDAEVGRDVVIPPMTKTCCVKSRYSTQHAIRLTST